MSRAAPARNWAVVIAAALIAAVSADGRYVFYSRAASNLLSGTIDPVRHLYRMENPLWEP